MSCAQPAPAMSTAASISRMPRILSAQMLTVHHLTNSRSQRVLWLLEELGTPYEIKKYERDAKTKLAPAALCNVHPLGKSPVITDGELTIAESGAILEYLVEKYGDGQLVPTRGTPDHLRHRYFMHYAEGSLMPMLVLKLVTSRIRTDTPRLVRPIAKLIADRVDGSYVDPTLAQHIGFLDKELAARPFIAGNELTIADIQMSYPLEAIAARTPNATARINAYVAKIRERPAYKRALDRAGDGGVLP